MVMAIKLIIGQISSVTSMIHKEANGAIILSLMGAVNEIIKLYQTLHWGIQSLITVMVLSAAFLKLCAGFIDIYNAIKNRGIRDE